MFQNFPYTDMHQLNLDWIIKIAKDFLDQYTHLQQLITDGEASLQNLTSEGLQQLQEKADNLEALLQDWYNTHSQDIANQLADALADIQTELNTTINNFNTAAENKTSQLLETIPDDYTVMYNNMLLLLQQMPTKMSAGIKGYAVPEDETQVEGTIFMGAVGSAVNTFNIENSSSVKYPVSTLSKLEITGYSWAPNNFGLYMFLDENNIILSKYPTDNIPITTEGMIVDVPVTAKYICVNGDTGHPAEVRTPIYEKSFEDSTKQFMKTYKVFYSDSDTQPIDGTIYKGTIGNVIQPFTYADGSYIKVDVSEYDSVSVSGTTFQVSQDFRLCFFTDENNIIVATVEVEQGAHSDVITAVPINAKYAYVNGNATQYARALPQLKYGEYNTNFEERTADFIKSDIMEFKQIPIAPTNGTIYKGVVGNTPTAFSYADGSFIKADIENYSQISITGNSFDLNRNFRICFFLDADNIIIGTVDNAGGYIDLIVNVPANTKYAIINGDATQYVTRAPKVKIPKPVANLTSAIEKYNPASGKNILLLGDSITKLGMSNRGWVKYFNNIVKANQIDNIAVNGARWTDYNDSTAYDGEPQNYDSQNNPQNVIGNQVQRIINNPNDFLSSYDYIMILAGVNDPIVDTIPTYADFNTQYYSGNAILPLASANRSTWPGATRYVIETLHNIFPDACIIISTILNPVAGYNTKIPLNTSEAIRTCGKIVSVPVCDIEQCGIRPDDTTMYVDTLHPSEKGAKVMGSYIARWFKHNM